MKFRFRHIKKAWGAIRRNWKVNHRLVILDESTHARVFDFKLNPRTLFVVVILAAFFLISLTTVLIAFTPLRVYVPGYTNPDEYRTYKKMAYRVDSLEILLRQNQLYLDNFVNVMNDHVDVVEVEEEAEKVEPHLKVSQKQLDKASAQLEQEVEQILMEISDKSTRSSIPISQKASIASLMISPPSMGVVTRPYSPTEEHYGIDIYNTVGTIISSVADGKVLLTGYSPEDGYYIIIQHPGEIISIYKSVESILKRRGDPVTIGEPIALMGKSGPESKMPHLHFELWFHGVPINPLEYLSIN